MIFDVAKSKNLTRNALLNHANKDAAYKQTDEEHSELLNKYIKPTDTPIERQLHIKQGIEEEKQYPKYWEDEKPRKDISPSSSFIDSVEVIPSLNMAVITMNNGKKSYQKRIPMNTKDVGDMITSPSIGQAFNRKIRGK